MLEVAGADATLILDVMGADRGPAEMVRGCGQFIEQHAHPGTRLVLVSAEPDATSDQVAREIQPLAVQKSCSVEVLPAEPLPDGEAFTSPVDIYKRCPRCSIRVAMEYAKSNGPSAVISPGSTGLVMTSALFTLGRLPGIARPPIVTPMPTRIGDMIFLDGGSNVDCKPEHLHQFAVLAHAYVQAMKGIQRPTVALLSNGSEEYKGNAQVKEARELLEADEQLNFVGYIEGHTVLNGNVDIMVCDGFLGNIVLKLAEGIAELFADFLRDELKKRPVAALASLVQRGAFRGLRNRIDYAQFGGAPLLGLNGNVVICHGRSSATAIANALAVGQHEIKTDAVGAVAKMVEGYVWEKATVA
jgi:glycerol-3-phosphate acyltransferase PlsX